jgi:hypothetical protein
MPPFSKMAAAIISKIIEILLFGHLSPISDEIWYTDRGKHAKFKKRHTGSVPSFSKMAAPAVAKIFEMLFFGYLSPDFDEIC